MATQLRNPSSSSLRSESPVSLSAQGSTDPDGNKITYSWFYYEEAASAISKAISLEEILGKRGEDYLNVPPKVRLAAMI